MSAYEWGQIVGGMMIPALLSGAAIWLGFRAQRQGRSGVLFWILGGVLALILVSAILNAAVGGAD